MARLPLAGHAPDHQKALASTGKTGALLAGAAALLWIVQAALLAAGVQGLADGGALAAVTAPALGFLLLGVLRASADAWASQRIFDDARACLSRLRAEAVARLAQRSPLDRNRPTSGQAAAILAEQADAVLPWLIRYQAARWRVMLVIPVIAVAVAWLSWVAALILVLAAPLIPLFMAVIGWRAKAASEQQLQIIGGMHGFLLDRLRGLSTLRALGAVDATARRLRATAERVRADTMRVLRIAFLSSTALELFSSLAVALVAVYIGFHLLGQIHGGAWGRRLTLGEGLFILLLAPAFFEPLRELAATWHDKAAGEAALAAMAGLHQEDSPAMLDALGMTPAQPAIAGDGGVAVTLQAVHFGHDGEAAVLDGVDLQIRAGEHVALMGASGAGKTTLLALIAGLMAPCSGQVLIDGVALDAGSGARLRARMAWLSQKPHLFAGSVQHNVTLGRPGASAVLAGAALARAGLGDVAHAGLTEQLGEGGSGLSGGELVRLALARATVTSQAGLLLADEPTAHLDQATAAAVIDALLAAARGRTLIVATHDPLLAARIGRVVQLDPAPMARMAS
ncbi:MAG: thiol reductant ABC exporter subunit CydD [Burkholderiaceae bacterium]|nr:thiol reductant ABC exporter subunit CydD [Burkholderiaceae bacterium]